MNDYLTIFDKFKDIKEINDFIDDVKKLRDYYNTQQYQQMQMHINSLICKYFVETIAWNLVNRDMPTTPPQAYINAEKFLQMQGAQILVKNVGNYKQYLTYEESSYIESLIKQVE